MTTEKQIKANQQNSKYGGVKTPEGKAISRFNAMKHGLLAKEVLIEKESEEELVELGRRMRSELKPASGMELVLVDRIVANTWRLKRVLRIEREMIEEDWKSNLFDQNQALGKAFSIDFSNNDTYGKLIRYEASIERGLFRALHELQRIQSARNGERPFGPMAVDIITDENENDGFVS